MLVLAIETSCDETAMALVEFDAKKEKIKILASGVSSQIKVHRKFGGVVPSLAAREHEKNLPIVLKKILENSQLQTLDSKIDIIFVTEGPGLIPSLLLGVNFARAIAYRYKIRILPVNHLSGHLYSPLISTEKLNQWQKFKKIEFPVISLIVSGGHTILLLLENLYKYKVLGETRDDAAGEAFDKVGRLLGLPYPAGSELEKLAAGGNDAAFNFPRPMIHQKNYEFSFAGLKTAVLYAFQGFSKLQTLNSKLKSNIAASFQKAVVDVLTEKTIRAAREFKAKTVLVGGGVINNCVLQYSIKRASRKLKRGIRVLFPDRSLTTDNALMIAAAGFLKLLSGTRPKTWKTIDADANLRL